MLTSFPFLTYLVVTSASLFTLAFLLYCQDRHSSELRWAARMLVSLGALFLVLISVLWIGRSLTAGSVAQAPVFTYEKNSIED
jgi:hypothetical protein